MNAYQFLDSLVTVGAITVIAGSALLIGGFIGLLMGVQIGREAKTQQIPGCSEVGPDIERHDIRLIRRDESLVRTHVAPKSRRDNGPAPSSEILTAAGFYALREKRACNLFRGRLHLL